MLVAVMYIISRTLLLRHKDVIAQVIRMKQQESKLIKLQMMVIRYKPCCSTSIINSSG
jgi:hypothetical protein